eukprot:77619-Amphidinium_carterae.1
MGEADLEPNDVSMVSRSSTSMNFATANGVVSSNMVLNKPIGSLNGEVATVRILPQSPSVLSAGKRIMEHGHSFCWWAIQKPIWYLPTGETQELSVKNFVPVLRR